MRNLLHTQRIAMTLLSLALPLLAVGNTVKVFDLAIDNVYNIYIDTTDSEVSFCFQTSDKLIKTNPQGEVIERTNNPYRYFTVLNGDTLILKGHAVIDINGETVVDYYGIRGSYQYIAASSAGIFVFQNVGNGSSVQDFLNGKRLFFASNLKGLCCSGGIVYSIQPQSVETYPSLLIWRNTDDSNSSSYQLPLQISDPRGIAEYGDYLYIYSNADKALYRIEAPLPQDQTVTESRADSINIGKDTIYFYEPNRNFSNLIGAGISPDNIDSVVLYSLTTDLYIQKTDDASKRNIESLVKQYLPDARFNWDSGQYDYRCSVTTNSPGLDEAVNALLSDNAIVSVSKRYIRKDVKDLIDLYPFADEVKVSTFSDQLQVIYLDESTWDEANSLIESMGLSFVFVDDSRTDVYKSAMLKAPKSMNVVSAANQLYESGYFLCARPTALHGTKKCQVQTIDHSGIPFYYGEQDGSKQYLYMVPGRFAVRKGSGTDRAQMASIIKSYCGNYSRITWLDEDYCMVNTYPDVAVTAMEALKSLDDVKWVSEQYLDNTFYVQSLKHAEKMTYWGLDGRLALVFKDNVTDAVRNNIINGYNLSLVSTQTKNDIVKLVYEVPKTKDVVSVCNSIYETGYVQYAVPNIIKEREAGLHFDGSTDTRVRDINPGVYTISIQYYDLLGRRMDSPAGLTIVVTRYSDGTVRTEKKLFKAEK